jgi:hypothetical protein
MRRSLPALATTLLVVLAACGGNEAAGDASSTSDQTSTSTTPITRSPPPSTLPPAGTLPPRVPGAPGSGSDQPTVPGTLPEGLAPASTSAIARLVGTAEWDDALPLPQSCVESASFEPAGPRGINGGVVRCTVFSSLADTAAFVRELNRQRRLVASESAGSGSVTFIYGGIARIDLVANGDDVTSFTASQLFASPTTTTTTTAPTTLPPPPPTLPPTTQPPTTQPPTTPPPT